MSPGLECEYGTSTVQSCDAVATCSSKMTWLVTAADSTDCSTVLPAACPLTFDVAAVGGTCTPSGTLCDYAKGRCECAVNALIGADPIMLLDSSAPAAHWVCQDPVDMQCPLPRPPLGSFCSVPKLVCDYGSCNIDGGTSEVCQGGVWQQAEVGCPG